MRSDLQDQIITDIARQMSDEMDRQILGITTADGYHLIYDQGTIYGEEYYTVAPVWEPSRVGWYNQEWQDMVQWCIETFGSTSDLWTESKNLTPTPCQRWYTNNAKFWFRDQRDRDWFTLRWSS